MSKVSTHPENPRLETNQRIEKWEHNSTEAHINIAEVTVDRKMQRLLQLTAPPGTVIVAYAGIPPYQHIPVYYLQYDSASDESVRKWLLSMLESHDSAALNTPTVKQVLADLTQPKESVIVSSHQLETYAIGSRCAKCGKCVGDDNFTDECQP